MGEVRLARVYGVVRPEPGTAPEVTRPAFLVDRLWPRGVAKEALAGVERLADVAPSAELRREFGHDMARWPEFRGRYLAELDARPQAAAPLLDALRHGDVTLLYAARDTEHNHAVVLRDWLVAHAADDH